MGKKTSNPLNTLKSAINKAGETVAQTYTEVSTDVSKIATQVMPQNIVTRLELESKIDSDKINLEKNNIIPNIISNELSPFEKHIKPLFIGCYSDDPSNPSMENYLGEVSNCLECIELGKKNNFKYIGVQQGNKCYGSNKIPLTEKVNNNEYCNIGCDDINTGNCGGFFYNQVYKTNLTDDENILNKNKVAVENILEKFISLDTDIEKINYGLSHTKFNDILPIDTNTIFCWLCILVVLLYLLFEYIYRKSKK